MNIVQLRGNSMKDSELRYLPSGDAMMELTIAVDKTVWDRERAEKIVRTNVFLVNVYADLAERVEDEGGVMKGDDVFVVGELDQQQRKDRDRPSTRITAVQVTRVRRRNREPDRERTDDPWASDQQ